jgi:magnesium transporter
MPELHWQYGYPLVLGVMGLVALAMLAFFRRRRWI